MHVLTRAAALEDFSLKPQQHHVGNGYDTQDGNWTTPGPFMHPTHSHPATCLPQTP